jgi:DNA-binding transcriptional ArsR family regulator
MKEIIAIAKALSDPNRLKALMLLCNGEFCVCQIVDFLKLAPSTVSKHMSILKTAGIVDSRKDEKWMYYRLAGSDATSAVKEILSWLSNNLDSKIQIPASITEKTCPKTKK